MLQTGIFEDLQRKIDEDTAIKDVSGQFPSASKNFKFQHTFQQLRDIVQKLEKQGMLIKTKST